MHSIVSIVFLVLLHGYNAQTGQTASYANGTCLGSVDGVSVGFVDLNIAAGTYRYVGCMGVPIGTLVQANLTNFGAGDYIEYYLMNTTNFARYQSALSSKVLCANSFYPQGASSVSTPDPKPAYCTLTENTDVYALIRNDNALFTANVRMSFLYRAPYQWRTTPWSNCTATCGGGSQWRTVSCLQTSTSLVVAASFCQSLQTTPSTVRACNTQMCTGDGETCCFDAGAGECAQATATGSFNGLTYCCYGTASPNVAINGGTLSCTCSANGPSPPCQGQAFPGTYGNHVVATWTTGAWSTCTATCGGGTQTRTVTCVDAQSGQPVTPTSCSSSAPATQQTCNTQVCPGGVSPCCVDHYLGQAVCNTAAFQQTHATFNAMYCCIGASTSMSYSSTSSSVTCSCTGGPQPVCGVVQPSYSWVPSPWSTTCAHDAPDDTACVGHQSRSLSCQASTPSHGLLTVSNYFCASLVSPATTQRCLEPACGSSSTGDAGAASTDDNLYIAVGAGAGGCIVLGSVVFGVVYYRRRRMAAKSDTSQSTVCVSV